MIRELARSDRAALAFAFSRLSGRSRYQRFLTPKRGLSETELDRPVRVDHWHHEALIAFSASPRMPLGVARYVRLEDFDTAEVAIVVVDKWQRRGVGRALSLALRERAVRAGVRCFTATMLRDNRAAHALAGALGPRRFAVADGNVVEITIEL